jgi:hypothetical protein
MKIDESNEQMKNNWLSIHESSEPNSNVSCEKLSWPNEPRESRWTDEGMQITAFVFR